MVREVWETLRRYKGDRRYKHLDRNVSWEPAWAFELLTRCSWQSLFQIFIALCYAMASPSHLRMFFFCLTESFLDQKELATWTPAVTTLPWKTHPLRCPRLPLSWEKLPGDIWPLPLKNGLVTPWQNDTLEGYLEGKTALCVYEHVNMVQEGAN